MPLEKVIEEGLKALTAAVERNTGVAALTLAAIQASTDAPCCKDDTAPTPAPTKKAKAKAPPKEKKAKAPPKEDPVDDVEETEEVEETPADFDRDAALLDITEYVKARILEATGEARGKVKENFEKLRDTYKIATVNDLPDGKLPEFLNATIEALPEA